MLKYYIQPMNYYAIATMLNYISYKTLVGKAVT